jgi:PKD repeat protein/pimeloyl-ACP methyl ester carboxylesterase
MSSIHYYFLLSIMLASSISFAQADLVLTTSSFEPQQIDKGDVLTVRTTVANTGNVTAAANYLFVYYSQDLTIEATEIVSRVSVRSLAPGEEQEIEFFYPTSDALFAGEYFVGLEVDPFNTVPESNEENLYCVSDDQNCITLAVTDFVVPAQRYNYPIIFIHGLKGDSETWDEFRDQARINFGWVYGGRLDYCLNPDSDQSTADTEILSFVDQATFRQGDYYTVNFDVNALGETFVSGGPLAFSDVRSNQSAVVKQGWAIQDAVSRVLEFSGAEKVILVGHSMGGLAGREYLQDPDNWQPDGEHHVAKLLTIGTPHGGSNTGIGPFSLLGGFDETSEAVRDLRHQSLFFSGQYLDGGVESSFSVFQNDDVNCNGQTGDLIIGLNEKQSPVDVDYACIIGDLSGLGGDGVVDADRADINNYLLAPPPMVSQSADRYTVGSDHFSVHTENEETIIRALDEPDFYELAYTLPLEKLQFSHVSEQAENHPILPPGDNVDWDDFIIEVPVGGRVDVRVWNIPVQTFGVFLYDLNLELVAQAETNGESQLALNANVPAGSYYVEFGSIPTPNSWRFPYAHFVNVTPAEPVVAAFFADVIEGCAPFSVSYSNQATGTPETYAWSFPGGTPATSSLPNPTVTYAETGSYSASLIVANETSSDTFTRTEYVEILTTPSPSFTYGDPVGGTVTFNNETQFTGNTPTYSWDFGDGETSTEPSPAHTFSANATYEVTLTATNQCGATTTTQSINLTTVSTADRSNEPAIVFSPNPAENIITLEVSGNFYGQLTATIVNNIGQLLSTRILNKNGSVSSFPLSVNDLKPGVYHLRLRAPALSRTIQFVKK